MSVDLRALIGKLNETTRKGLEAAAGIAVSRTHYDADIEHWLFKLIEEAESDIPRILRHFDIEPDRILQQLDRALDQLKTGNSRRPDLSESIEVAWMPDGDHSFKPRVKSGYSLDQNLAACVEAIAQFIAAL